MSSGKKGIMNAVTQWGVADRQLSNTERWVALIVLLVFGTVSMFNQVKPTSVLMEVGASFGMELANVGNLMTFFSMTGLIISMPGVWIMRNVGIKSSLTIGGIVTLAGSLLGVTATSAGMMLFSRVLEGMGLGIITVIGPNVIPRLFPERKFGLAMGVWSIWPAGGMIISSFAGPALFNAYGWHSIWWCSIILTAVSMILVLAFCKMNQVPESELADGDITRKRTVQRAYVGTGLALAASDSTIQGVWSAVPAAFFAVRP